MDAHDEDRERRQHEKTSESLIRLEAKIDVVLGRHEARLEDLTRRQGEQGEQLREHDSRITANALTVAETRQQVLTTAADLQAAKASARSAYDNLRKESAADIEAARPKNIPAWVAIGVSALALILSPIISALLK